MMLHRPASYYALLGLVLTTSKMCSGSIDYDYPVYVADRYYPNGHHTKVYHIKGHHTKGHRTNHRNIGHTTRHWLLAGITGDVTRSTPNKLGKGLKDDVTSNSSTTEREFIFIAGKDYTTTTKRTSPTTLKTPATTANVAKHIWELYEGGHSVAHPEACRERGANLRMLIMVMSAPSHGRSREFVRSSWAHYARSRRIAVLFFVGRLEGVSSKLRAKIRAENAKHCDIVIGKFVDSYRNLTLKSVSMLEWASTYCPRVRRLMKTDDDVFVNIPNLMEFAGQPDVNNATNTIWGNEFPEGIYPKRAPRDKNRVSFKEFPGTIYPSFAKGAAYMMTMDAAQKLLEGLPSETYIPVEDVLITGIAAEHMGVKREFQRHFVIELRQNMSSCELMRAVAVHLNGQTEHDAVRRQLYRLALGGHCEGEYSIFRHH